MRSFFFAMVGSLALAGCGHDAEHGTAAHGGAEGAPSSTAITPVTTDAVYIVNGEDSSISVLDAATGAPLGTIRLQNVAYPHHVYLSPDRGSLAVAVPGHDLSGGHSTAPRTGGEHNGEHGSSSTGGVVLVLDATTGATVNARRLDAPNHNAAFSPDGSEIWTAQLSDCSSSTRRRSRQGGRLRSAAFRPRLRSRPTGSTHSSRTARAMT